MPDPLKTFGKIIRTLRHERGLTQEKLAEICGRHPVYISELERGLKNPSLDSILRLCKALKISSGGLMDLIFPPGKGEPELLKNQILHLLEGKSSQKLKVLLVISKAFLEADF